MNINLKKALVISAVTLTLVSCSTIENKQHTEAYKGGYYADDIDYQSKDDQAIVDGISLKSGDFNHAGADAAPAYEANEDSEAQRNYRFAMTLRDSNPRGMIEALYIASEQGSGDAHYELARELTSGKYLDNNLEAAQEHLRDGIALNHAESYRVLGMMNLRGDSIDKNVIKGLAMLENAAKTSVRAMRELGGVYQGKAYPEIKNTNKAIQYLTQAYIKGDVQSAYMLGVTYYELGQYIDAAAPLSYAARKGDGKAKQLLTKIK